MDQKQRYINTTGFLGKSLEKELDVGFFHPVLGSDTF